MKIGKGNFYFFVIMSQQFSSPEFHGYFNETRALGTIMNGGQTVKYALAHFQFINNLDENLLAFK